MKTALRLVEKPRIPERRPVSHHRRGIVLIINQEHLAKVLRVKQEAECGER